MQVLRNSLLCLLLAILATFAAKLCLFLDQASIVVADGQAVLAAAGPQLIGAAMEVRGAAREQRSYYKGTGKALAIATINAARLIEHTDQAVQNLDKRTAPVIADTDKLVRHIDASQEALEGVTARTIGDIDAQVQVNGAAIQATLTAARNGIQQTNDLVAGPVANTLQSTENSAAHLDRATGSIQIALEPLRKTEGKLKLILKWLLGLPHFTIVP